MFLLTLKNMMGTTMRRCAGCSKTAAILAIPCCLILTLLVCNNPVVVQAFQATAPITTSHSAVFLRRGITSSSSSSFLSSPPPRPQQRHVSTLQQATTKNTHDQEDENNPDLSTTFSARNNKRIINIPRRIFQWLQQSRRRARATRGAAVVSSSAALTRGSRHRRRRHRLRSFRKAVRAFTVSLFLAMVLRTGGGHFNNVDAAWAVSGGRMGGSFKPSTSRTYSSPVPSSRSSPRMSGSSSGGGYRPRSYGRPSYSSPPSRVVFYPSPPVFPTTTYYGARVAPRRSSPGNILIMTGAGALLAFGAYNHLANNNYYSGRISDEKSVLGPGATTASITVCLDVPNRNSPDSVLSRLESLADKVDTSRRKGVQDLISNVALELLRQEKSIFSGQAQSQHFSTAALAEREFQRRSVESRSKFDRESVNKFGDQDLSEGKSTATSDMQATSAIVTIHMAIQGDSTKLSGFRFRADLLNNLRRIAADAQVEDCLVAAEVDWTPSEPGETLSRKDVYADYPDLIPL